MKKFDNFSNCLAVLQQADFEMANDNEIYRTGVVGQFNLTFELAWKALQAVMREHGIAEANTGSPREMLQLGYKFGFVDDAEVWLMMLKKRNLSVRLYNEAEIDELLIMIRDSFIPAFEKLRQTLLEKLEEMADEPV
ncbi:nucleotidyltransferase [Eubacteriaceae bacterium RF-744-FAT-4]|uniref:Nucleotidyltransferase n=2 Tax=Pseudoramibacter porci TaxID=2606631 RepID=A0A7X2NFY6_9FIRM|nr:nucleotidyltransferase [Pseudoramibacter porci]